MDTYEKKYKEALGWMQSLYNGLHGKTKEEAERYFPELKESEDEKIRKEIINYFQCQSEEEPTRKEIHNKWLAWLEKQGEHANFCNKIQIGDKVTRNKDGVLVNLSQLNRVAKPADKAEPKFKVGDWITNGDYTWKIVEVEPLDYILQSQDGNIVDDTISHVDEQFHSFTIEDAKEAMYDKPAWSEDDEKIITGIINDIQKRLEDYPLEQLAEIYFKEIDWLKSLKQRIGG